MRLRVQIAVAVVVTGSLTSACLQGCGTTTDDAAQAGSEGGAGSDDASGGQHPDVLPIDDASGGSTGDADSGMKMVQTCVPLSCFQSCGVVPNGCGGTMQCGSCPSGEACSSVGHCVVADGGVPADGGTDGGTADAALDAAAADGCVPTCTTGHVCVSSQVQGGCVGCNNGPPKFACAPLPTGCGATVDCTCAMSVCPVPYACVSASASEVVCVEAVP